MVYESCSDTVILMATIGWVVVYLLVGLVVGSIVKALTKNGEVSGSDELFIMSVILWPIALIALLVYIVSMWILFPFVAATREYVDKAENRVNRRIDRECSTCLDVADDLDIFDVKVPFKAGDIVTGTVPQTDKDGNNISYDHLYRGCRCRVLSIDRSGSMKVILISHKDRDAHAHVIGETFDAPARNFTLVKKVAKKRKVVKKVAKRRARR